MLMFSAGAWAQTDVTSTYITNAGFDDCSAETSDVAAKTIKDYSSNGWTNAAKGDYTTIAVTAYGGGKKVGSSTTPSTKKDGTTVSGNTLGIIAGWADDVIIQSGDITLPAGVYTLTVDHYLTSSTNNYTTSRFGFVTTSTSYLVSSTSFTASTWTTETVSFILTESTTGKIQIGLKGNNNSGSGAPAVFYDDVTLTQYSDDDLRSINGLTAATYANPIVTNFVVNGTFDSNGVVSPWQRTGTFQNNTTANNKQGAFTGNFYENWDGSASANKMYQTITNIPNGTYRLDIAAFVNTLASSNNSQYVFANNDKTYLTTGDPTAYEVYTVVTNNQIEVGLEQTTATANWMGIDNVSLRYYGAGDVINAAQNASHKLAWEEAKAAANAALANSDYTNVTGSEKTALQTEIAKAEPSTAQGYDDATLALNNATNAFMAAKTNYDLFATYNADLAYADNAKKPVITDETTAASIITALRAYYESHALAEGVTGAVNMTDRITNANNPTNNDGWTWTGNKNNPASNEPWTDADGTNTHSYFDGGNWGASSWTTTMSQDITLPSGRYLLTAKARSAANVTFTMAVGGDNVALPHVGSTGNVFDRGWGDASLEFTTNGAGVTITVTATTSTVHEWFSISDFRLVQLEAIVDLSALQQAWEDAKNAASTTFYATAYENVTGSEQYALYQAIQANPSTAEEYEAAIQTLSEKVAAFIAAAPAYNRYVSEKANAERIDDSVTEGIASPYTAAQAETAYKDILVAEFNYVDANFNANAAEAYGITIDQWTGTATSGGNNDTPQTNSNQKWGEDATTYYEQGVNGWGSNAWTLNYTKTVTLPASTYVLKVAARASEGVTAVLSATVDGTTYLEDLPNVGASGMGIDIYGYANFDETYGEYANNNAGFGWQWRYLAFTLANEGEVTLEIDAHADSEHQWCSFGDVAVVSNVDITDLTTAFYNITLPTLGFNDGECAPYNNVEGLEAYAEADAIVNYMSAPSTQPDVDALTAKLQNLTWVTNDDDVDAVFNGNFSEDGGLTGWTRTNAWGQQRTDVYDDINGTTTGYYNQPGSLKYGDTGLYTMPLDPGTIYTLTLKYASWEEGSNNGMTVSVLNSENEGMAAKTLAAYKTRYTDGLTEETIYFVTARDYGNYERNHVLTIANSGNTVITGVSITKDDYQELVFADGAPLPNYAPGTYPTVRVIRPMSASKWVTAIYPFAVIGDIYNKLEIAKLDSYDASTGNIGFSTTGGSSVANQPFLMRLKEGVDKASFTIYNAWVYEPVAEDATKNEASLKGVYTTTEIDNTAKNYVLSNNVIYPVGTAGATIKPYRAYIQIDQSSAVKALNFFVDDDEATGIDNLNVDDNLNGVIYNVAGQRLNKVQKGINIVNGKKILR